MIVVVAVSFTNRMILKSCLRRYSLTFNLVRSGETKMLIQTFPEFISILNYVEEVGLYKKLSSLRIFHQVRGRQLGKRSPLLLMKWKPAV
jgi:hypothetical protein